MLRVDFSYSLESCLSPKYYSFMQPCLRQKHRATSLSAVYQVGHSFSEDFVFPLPAHFPFQLMSESHSPIPKQIPVASGIALLGLAGPEFMPWGCGRWLPSPIMWDPE